MLSNKPSQYYMVELVFEFMVYPKRKNRVFVALDHMSSIGVCSPRYLLHFSISALSEKTRLRKSKCYVIIIFQTDGK